MPPVMPVLIESLCRRPAGQNIIDLGDGAVYDFRDDGTGAQVALVSNPEHQRKLLSIAEGFAFYGAATTAPLELDTAGFLGTLLPASFIPGEDPANTVAVAHSAPQAIEPADAARLLLEHIVYYNLADRHGQEFADAFVNELSLIAEGRVLYGATADTEAGAVAAKPEAAAATVAPAEPVKPQEPATDLSVSDHADLNGKTLAEIRAIYAQEWGKPASPRHTMDVLVSKIESIREERAKGPAN